MRPSDFDFELPDELIAQFGLQKRDESRLLVLDRATGALHHKHFTGIGRFLRDDDLLVVNDSKVIRARLHGLNAQSAGKFEVLLVEEVSTNDWWAMLKPGKRARVGTSICITDHDGTRTRISATITETNEEGHRRIRFAGTQNILDELEHVGEVPLPPYIQREARKVDVNRYQTVFARSPGSVAAPTAGLHFTPESLEALRDRGIDVSEITLHVGLGTFAPVKADRLESHVMHEERFTIPPDVADRIAAAKAQGRRIVAVGTTALRTLESAWTPDGLCSGHGRTQLFVYPPFKFHVVDALLTNFHLARSTLLMLVSAFVSPGETHGREILLKAYQEAVRERYRFFSYGDAMLIV